MVPDTIKRVGTNSTQSKNNLSISSVSMKNNNFLSRSHIGDIKPDKNKQINSSEIRVLDKEKTTKKSASHLNYYNEWRSNYKNQKSGETQGVSKTPALNKQTSIEEKINNVKRCGSSK